MGQRFILVDDSQTEPAPDSTIDPNRFVLVGEGSNQQLDMNSPYKVLGVTGRGPDSVYSSILEFANAIPGVRELASGVNAAYDAATGPETFGQAYENYRSRWKQGVQAAEDLSSRLAVPYTSTANTLAGGLASMGPLKLASGLPLIGPAIGNIFGVSEAALGANVGQQVAREGAKAALKSYAGNVSKAAAQNALAGGLAGYAGGEGGVDERLKSGLAAAILGGKIGAGASAGLGAIGGIAKAAGPATGDLISSMRSIFKEELPPTGGTAAAQVPDDLIVASFARELSKSGMSPEEIANSLAKFQDELAGGNPTFVAEAAEMATGKPGLYTRTKFVGATPESQAIAANALADREAGLVNRSSRVLGEIGEQRDVFDVGTELKTLGGKIMDLAEEETRVAAGKAYSELYKTVGKVNTKVVKDLLKEPIVKSAIERARELNTELRKLPDNHFRVLERAYRYLRDESGELAKSGAKQKRSGKMTSAPTEAKDMKQSFVDPLLKELDKHAPNYKGIRDEYGEMMNKIKSIDSSGIEVLEKLKENQLDDAIDKLFDQSPAQIERFLDAVDTYAPEGRILMRDAARLRLSNAAYSPEQYAKVFKKWATNDPVMNKKLELVAGKDAVQKLHQGARREQTYQLAKGRYAVGSQTAPRGMEEEAKKNFVSNIVKLIKSPFKTGMKGIDVAFNPQDDLLNQALARAFFEPKYGLQIFEKALPLAQRQARNQQRLLNAPNLGQALARSFATPSGTVFGALNNLNRE